MKIKKNTDEREVAAVYVRDAIKYGSQYYIAHAHGALSILFRTGRMTPEQYGRMAINLNAIFLKPKG